MGEFVPFMLSSADNEYLQKYASYCAAVRVPLDVLGGDIQVPAHASVWLDPAVDGLHDWPDSTKDPRWINHIRSFKEAEAIADPAFHRKPEKAKTRAFVGSVLGHMLDTIKTHQLRRRVWVTVPQLPIVAGAERNSINRQLASCYREWNGGRRISWKGVLPLIFTHRDQLKGKTQRTPKIRVAEKCLELAGADGYWAVDLSLSDQLGTGTLSKRLRSVVELHDELRATIKTSLSVAGPYWGLNLVLWSRGMISYPAIGLGRGYQYHLSGGVARPSATRVALAPLRRTIKLIPDVKDWLSRVISTAPLGKKDRAEFARLLKSYRHLQYGGGRPQVSAFYKRWIEHLVQVPSAGRALALYQDLSTAYVTGKQLPDLPKGTGTAVAAERVAEQLMLTCL